MRRDKTVHFPGQPMALFKCFDLAMGFPSLQTPFRSAMSDYPPVKKSWKKNRLMGSMDTAILHNKPTKTLWYNSNLSNVTKAEYSLAAIPPGRAWRTGGNKG